MDIERIGIALSAVLTHERDAEISLRDHILIRMACNRIVEKADIEDIKIALCANPDVVREAVESYDAIKAVFDDPTLISDKQ